MKKPIHVKPQLLSRLSQSLVLESIREYGPSTRAEISSRLGVTFPTTAKAVGSLLDARLIEEYDDDQNSRGRPAKRVRLAQQSSQVIGIELDSPECRIVAAGFDGTVRPQTLQSFRTPSSYEELVARIIEHLDPLMHRSTDPPVTITLGIGLTVPGLVDYRQHVVHFSANLPILNNRSIAKDIARHTNVNCQMFHDTHALCMAESMSRRSVDSSTGFVMLVHRAGIGLGVMIDGEFMSGCDGFAGEIGHTSVVQDGKPCSCGKTGCLETVASQWALLQQISQHFGRDIDLSETIDLARDGNPFVKESLAEASRYLAIVVANIINVFNPRLFFVHGRLFDELPWFLQGVIEQAALSALPPAYQRCSFELAECSLIEGSVASIINQITASRTPQVI